MSDRLAAWARSKDPKVDRAQKLVDALPQSITDHGAAVPFPVADKNEYKSTLGDDANRKINHAIKHAPVESVSLDGLHAIQHSVHRERLKAYMAHPGAVKPGTKNLASGTPIDEPIVVECGGKRYIHDGHHRLTAEKLLGAKSAKARVVRLDSGPREKE